MKLENKKELAARALNVGKNRVVFNIQRLSEIKEAITKQDIKDLKGSGAIFIKEEKGRRKVERRKTRRRAGSIKKKVKNSKRQYIILTRKLRAHLAKLKSEGRISREQFVQLRKEIKARNFRDLSHLKEKIIFTKSKSPGKSLGLLDAQSVPRTKVRGLSNTLTSGGRKNEDAKKTKKRRKN